MADRVSKEVRSRNMSKIKGKNTLLEQKVRKELYRLGYRYRLNVSKLPGKPDLVLNKYKVAIFVNGCFWHHHKDCRLAVVPKSNVEFWEEKLNKNIERDKRKSEELALLGYEVLTLWECEIENNFEETISKTDTYLKSRLEKKIE